MERVSDLAPKSDPAPIRPRGHELSERNSVWSVKQRNDNFASIYALSHKGRVSGVYEPRAIGPHRPGEDDL
jgi:hypothetical protein